MNHYSTTAANLNSAEYRLAQRTAPASREQRIATMARALTEMRDAGMEWTAGYKALAAQLAQLESEAR